MAGTILELVNNQKTKGAANYKILFCDSWTTFKHSSKEENKKRKKETSRDERVFANLHHNESNLLSRMREARFYTQVILSFFLIFSSSRAL